jgi:hypothetical protein
MAIRQLNVARSRSGVMAPRVIIAPLCPRGLSREDAAAYCGLSAAGFDDWVKRRIVPGPIPGTQRWDRKAIDLALDRASGLESGQEQDDVFERWRAAYNARTL